MKPSLRKRLERYKTILIEFPEEDIAFKLKRLGAIARCRLIRKADKQAKKEVKAGNLGPEDADLYSAAVFLQGIIQEPGLSVEEVLELPGDVFTGLLKRMDEESVKEVRSIGG